MKKVSISNKKSTYLWIGTGVFCLIYFLAAAAFRITFSKFFAVAGVFFIAIGLFKIYLREKWRKTRLEIIIHIFRAAFALFIISFIIIEALIAYHGTIRKEEKVDYIVVLGAGLWGDTPSLALAERLDEAIEYIKAYPDTKIVLSGGKGPGETLTEAEGMKRYLIQRGVKESLIIKEEKSRSTEENFKFTKELLSSIDRGSNLKIMIITNNFHEFRSKLLAEREGFIAYEHAAPLHPLLIPAYYVREYFAVIKSLFL